MLEDAQLLDNDFDGNGSNRSWGTNITVSGTNYATSLFWQPLQNKEDPYSEVEEASEGVLDGADLFCIKGGKAPQFGICVSSDGYDRSTPVATVPLAIALSDKASFIAVFKVDEGWWYTCIRNDIILSDGDMLFLNENDAKEQFMSMLAVPDWGRKIAPASWGIEDTETHHSLEKILSKSTKVKLQKIKGIRGPKLYLIIGLSVVVFFWIVSSLFDMIFLTPSVRPMVVPIQPKIIPKIEKIPEIKPWENVYNPQEVLSECYMGVKNLVSIRPPGWEIGPIACTPQGLITAWTRKIGRLSWAKQALEQSSVPFTGYSFSDTGTSLVANAAIKKLSTVKSPPVYDKSTLINVINDQFQSIGQNISITSSNFTSPEGTIYNFVTFRFSSKYNPKIWSDLLVKYSGLEIRNIKYTPSGETWDYEGAIYAL